MNAPAKTRFAQIVLPRIDEGYRLAHWLTGNATDAEDVIQEACLRAYRAIDSFVDGNPRAWFLTIVRNCAYSWLRQHRPRVLTSFEDLGPEARQAIEAGNGFSEEGQTPEQMLIAKDEADDLRRAISALPLHLKETLVLREYHGLSYKEIAALSEVPMGTVMSRLAKARQSLITRVKEGER